MKTKTKPRYFKGVFSARRLNEIGIIKPTQVTSNILIKVFEIQYRNIV